MQALQEGPIGEGREPSKTCLPNSKVLYLTSTGKYYNICKIGRRIRRSSPKFRVSKSGTGNAFIRIGLAVC
ncbi:UNVERIFIED_CONTAM: hypothetical protein PYX00_002112 [Menopon gallinae]|uniref:Uncharacterized protein n=1 Tax=Menopon gallinae TaxID=328185 RepID=A0AAW2IGE7_9NEOP